MRVLIQRVKLAEVYVDGERIAHIDKGILAFLGIASEDDESQVDFLTKKLSGLRIFADEGGKMNLSVQDVEGSVLLVSQFTLCADTGKGRRPDFFTAAGPAQAKKLYELFIERLKEAGINIETGEFGAMMQVHLINDGPVTFLLEK